MSSIFTDKSYDNNPKILVHSHFLKLSIFSVSCGVYPLESFASSPFYTASYLPKYKFSFPLK